MSGPKPSQAPARLVRGHARAPRAAEWDADARWLLEAPRGFLRVLGGPGSGKTTLLEQAAARRMRDGTDPEHVLMLTASRRAADAIRGEITTQLTADTSRTSRALPRTVREPLVRTVHSYAYAVLRSAASARGVPPPRLLSGPEQDVLVRELLAGDVESGAHNWPERLRPALTVPGFAEQLRDLLMRAAERGLGPEDLVTLGRKQRRDEWVAAGKFWRQYEEVTLLQGAGGHAMALPAAPALDAAELVSAALLALEEDAALLASQRAHTRHLFVDDAHHLDPLQWRLLRQLGAGADEFVLAGDPDQSVFSFRGADPAVFTDIDPGGQRTVALTRTHRMSPAVRAAVHRLAENLAGPAGHRVHTGDENAEPGRVRVRLFPSPSVEASWVADQLRRAHLIEQVPWSQMGILVRSPARSVGVLQRALRAAGVPVASAGTRQPLATQPGVAPLLTVLRVAADQRLLDAETAETLLSAPIGGADPLAVRRLRRGLRRLELAAGGERSSDELLVHALRDNDLLVGLADAEAEPVRRVSSLLAEASVSIERGAGVEHVLWDLWQGSGLERRWTRQLARGGSLAAQADRDLDAVVALFHAAASYVDRVPGAAVAEFAEYLSSQQIAGDSLAPTAAAGDGVSLLSAHAAAGREWTVVAIAGLQEGSWPDLRLRGSLLGVERLVDRLSGVDDDSVSATAPLLAEERRLCYVAASRASQVLLVSATQGEEEQPSRFLHELSGHETGEASDPGTGSWTKPAGRALARTELMGELRRVVCDPDIAHDRREIAARQLARLAAAGVPGAHPDDWYGLGEPSTDAPMRRDDSTIHISPSTVELLTRCPLRWLLERHGGSDPVQLPAVTGTLVHALAQAAASGADDAALRAVLDEAWARVDAGAPWFSRRERRRVEQMVRNFLSWLGQSRTELDEAGVELDVTIELPRADEHDTDEPAVRLRGRVDRLERDQHGRPVVVDLKSGKTVATAAETVQHPQLAVYQLAILLGAFGEPGQQPGGAKLVYLGKSHTKTGAAQREQPPLDANAATHWLSMVRSAAAATGGPDYVARENSECDRCPVRTACPIRSEGRQVTSS